MLREVLEIRFYRPFGPLHERDLIKTWRMIPEAKVRVSENRTRSFGIMREIKLLRRPFARPGTARRCRPVKPQVRDCAAPAPPCGPAPARCRRGQCRP